MRAARELSLSRTRVRGSSEAVSGDISTSLSRQAVQFAAVCAYMEDAGRVRVLRMMFASNGDGEVEDGAGDDDGKRATCSRVRTPTGSGHGGAYMRSPHHHPLCLLSPSSFFFDNPYFSASMSTSMSRTKQS